MTEVYFDNAATTRVSPLVAEEVAAMLQSCYGNPSSLHTMGLAAEKAVNEAAERVAAALGCQPGEIVFTSGGTESNNLALFGAALANKRKKHIISVSTEHPSVLEPLKVLREVGYDVTILNVDNNGQIDMETLQASLREDTALVSIMAVNNETGVLQDVASIGKTVKSAGALFHVDGVQAFGKIPVSLKNIDLFTLSAHKIHGIKGAGALYVKKGTHLKPLMYGGGQQKDRRPGTENTPGIVSLGVAASLAKDHMDENYEKVLSIKKCLLDIRHEFEDVIVNGDEAQSSPYLLNLSFPGVRGEVLLHALADDGIYVSTGSACSSNKKGPLRYGVIGMMNGSKDVAESAVRFSFSHENTVDEAEYCKEMLKKHIGLLRKYRRR